MKVLLTGDGVAASSVVRTLLARGHEVRLLSPNAAREAMGWPHRVEAWPADFGSRADVSGAAAGCQAVIHLAGLTRENPPRATFAGVNVEGTRALLAEAEGESGVSRFLLLSTLLADRAASGLQRSKLEAEGLLRTSALRWTVLRTSTIYGPGDPSMRRLVSIARLSPVLPRLEAGWRRLRPLWHEDFGEAVARTLERDDLAGRTLLLTGPEEVALEELLARLAVHVGRRPTRLSVPAALATLGGEVARALGVERPMTQALGVEDDGDEQIPPGRQNDLQVTLGLDPTGLERGLAELVRATPEMPPSRGAGPLERRVYRIDIRRGWRTAEQVRQDLRTHFAAILPLDVPAQDRPAVLGLGDVLWMNLPTRGKVGLRVMDVTPDRLTLVTLEGQPLAATVGLLVRAVGDGVRFEVEVNARAAGGFDSWLVPLAGGFLQDALWRSVAERLAMRAGGESEEGVLVETSQLVGDEARTVDDWADALVARLQRERRGNLGAERRPPRRHRTRSRPRRPRTATGDRRVRQEKPPDDKGGRRREEPGGRPGRRRPR